MWGMGGRGSGMGRGWGRGMGWGMPTAASGQMPQIPPPSPGILRVAASTEDGRGLEAVISYRFGRAPYMTIVDINESSRTVLNAQSFPNAFVSSPRGVGVAVGQWLVLIGVKRVLAPHLGPNISLILGQAGIRVDRVQPGVRVLDALRLLGLIA